MTLVGQECWTALSRVLVAIDDDALAPKVVRVAALMSTQLGADLGVVHAVELPDYPPEAYAASVDLANRAQAEAERHVRETLRTAGIVPARQWVVAGWPVDVVLAAALEWTADLLLAGHGRRTGWAHSAAASAGSS